MTIQETAMLMEILTVAYPRFYAGPEAPDRKAAVRLWADLFAGEEAWLVTAAVKAYIAADTKGYPPHIGAIKEAMYRLSAGEDSEARAWALVREAAANSGYQAKAAFEKLPEDVREIVGTPAQLREWGMMDSKTFNSVVASNFQRAYRARMERNRLFALAPPEVRRRLGGERRRALPQQGDGCLTAGETGDPA